MTDSRPPGRRYTVLHVITGLETGGAEKILVRLVRGLADRDVGSSVIALKRSGSIIQEELAELGVPVRSVMGAGSKLDLAAGLPRLFSAVSSAGADLIQGWMYHGNLAASLARAICARRTPLVWSIHHTLTNLESEKAGMRRVLALGRRLSRGPEAIHYVSYSSAAQHADFGFHRETETVIANACDTDRFQRDGKAAAALRAQLGLEPDARLIGHVAGFRPMKDHGTLLAAHRLLVQQPGASDVHLVLVGPGVGAADSGIRELMASHPVPERVHLLGERADVAWLMSAFDIATLSSAYGESCPTVVLEAMACETPCVVTDVGDSARLVDRFGGVVAPRDARALARAWSELLALGPDGMRALGTEARAHVVDHYGMQAMVQAFDDLYACLLSRSAKEKTPEP